MEISPAPKVRAPEIYPDRQRGIAEDLLNDSFTCERTTMIGILIDIVTELFERLGGSIVKATKKKSLKIGLLIMFGLAGIVVLVFYPGAFSDTIAFGRRWVMASVNRSNVPLRGEEREQIDTLIRHLGESLYSTYSKHFERSNSIPSLGAWNTAQISIALSGLNLPNRPPIKSDKIAAYLQETRSADCVTTGTHCWMESPNDSPLRANIGASAWVLYAKARLGFPAEPGEIRFFLSQQNSADDSWPMLPCKEAGSGSVYATAWSIMALGEQVRRGLVQEPLLGEVRNSIRSGISWLEMTQSDTGLWKTYPNRQLNEVSISNSGLAIHVLDLSEESPFPRLRSKWMKNISGRRAPAYKAETFNSWVCEAENEQRDYTRYLVLPWEIIATVDSYSEGGVLDRARALRLIEETGAAREEIVKEINPGFFMAAELLIALRHLRESFLDAEPVDVWQTRREK